MTRRRRPLALAIDGVHTVVVCACGPSFDEEQASLIVQARKRGECYVIAVSNSFLRVPNADSLYSGDGKWWDHYMPQVRETFRGTGWTLSRVVAHKYGLRVLGTDKRPGLTDRDGWIRTGQNSGYQAINLAFLLGARRIVLVGFDMQAAPNGDQHWFGEHPPIPQLRTKLPFKQWIRAFGPLADDLAAEGVEVLNASAVSALTQFPRVSLTDALAAP